MILLIFAGSIAQTGCKSSKSSEVAGTQPEEAAQQQYANDFAAIMNYYNGEAHRLASRPLPDRSVPKKNRRIILARDIGDLAHLTDECVRRMDALQPPADLREIHATTRAFFRVSSEGNRQWSQAILSGSKDASKISTQSEAAEKSALIHVRDTATRLPPGTPGKEALLKSLQQAIDQYQ